MIAFFWMSCTDDQVTQDQQDEEILLKGITVDMASLMTSDDINTKAIGDFAVNTSKDPTLAMNTRLADWKLDVQIYKGSQPYQYGKATCSWNTTDSRWEPDGGNLYFPNYSHQSVSAKLYPPLWNNVIGLNQQTADSLLYQDVLIQNGTSTVTVRPAHEFTIQMKHAHSMLDFILENVDESQIDSVTIQVGDNIYEPYKVTGVTRNEYLVILPVGTANPEIHLKTVEGARYTVQVEITSTAVNNCYCIKLDGIELILTSVTVTNWVYGEALSGEYTTIASYPTFRGPASTSITVFYLNGLSQVLTFNERGESTPKPLGRTILSMQLSSGETIELDPPLILNTMYVDLNPYIVSE